MMRVVGLMDDEVSRWTLSSEVILVLVDDRDETKTGRWSLGMMSHDLRPCCLRINNPSRQVK